jgi:5-methylcytosine-specific restriction endonuclease McrA
MSISPSTKHLLWVKAAGRCAFPDCRANLIAEATKQDPAVPLGEMAHIVPQSEERGPRHKFEVPGGDRDGYENLILLCPACHTRIDRQPQTYTVERLLQLKADHETWVLERLNPEEARIRASATRSSVPEQVHSTMLWVEQMPRYIYTAPCTLTETDVRPHIRAARPEDLLPFIVREKKLITFAPLDERPNPFSKVIQDLGAAERHESADWWKDPNLSSWYVTLLNRLLNKITGRRGLNLDRQHKRYYFEPVPAEAEEGEPQPREVKYRPLNKVVSSKQVAWRPRSKKTGELKKYWEHLAVGLRFHRISLDQWVLSIRPERRFTRDGYTVLTPKGTGRRSTSKKSRMYNYDLLGEVQFWRDYLTDGGQRLIVPLGGPSLILDGTLLSATVYWPGVPGDKRPFLNAVLQDDLFSSAEYHAALESDGEAELDEWEVDLEEELEEELTEAAEVDDWEEVE